MKKLLLTLAVPFIYTITYAQAKSTAELTAGYDQTLSQHFKATEPGLTALVSRKGQVLYKKAFGAANTEMAMPMQTDHVFRIGSITKQFTAVAILQLMEQGKLSLQDEITRFIPDYPTQGAKITIEHLLTHTSGIQSYTGMKDYMERMTLDLQPGEMIDHFKNEPMKFSPGTKWNYSNSNYFLLGYIIEKLTGKTYGEYLHEAFFKPLGMNNSSYGGNQQVIGNQVAGYEKGEKGFESAQPLSMTQPYAAGSILSTVEDLFKWHQAVHSYKLVRKESLDKAFTNYKLGDGQEANYGYGWRFGYVQGSPTIEHGGGINGFKTMEIYLPKEDVFVAVFSNCGCSSPEEVASKMAAQAIGKPYEHKEVALENDVLQGYAGVYENEKGEQRIMTVSDNSLYSQRGRAPKFKVKAWQKDKFFLDDALLTLDFSRNTAGEIERLTTYSRSGTEVWNKSNNPVHVKTEIKVDEKVLAAYTGEYEVTPQFTFSITNEKDRLFLQATGQEKLEMFAETNARFFLKVNDAQLEFVKGDSGLITKAILNQGGRSTDAKKIK